MSPLSSKKLNKGQPEATKETLLEQYLEHWTGDEEEVSNFINKLAEDSKEEFNESVYIEYAQLLMNQKRLELEPSQEEKK